MAILFLHNGSHAGSALANEHEVLKNQIESLKAALEQAQIDRRRKIEYDAIADKINTLPSRAELNQYVRFQEACRIASAHPLAQFNFGARE